MKSIKFLLIAYHLKFILFFKYNVVLQLEDTLKNKIFI